MSEVARNPRREFTPAPRRVNVGEVRRDTAIRHTFIKTRASVPQVGQVNQRSDKQRVTGQRRRQATF